jgi:hypothetical protein
MLSCQPRWIRGTTFTGSEATLKIGSISLKKLHHSGRILDHGMRYWIVEFQSHTCVHSEYYECHCWWFESMMVFRWIEEIARGCRRYSYYILVAIVIVQMCDFTNYFSPGRGMLCSSRPPPCHMSSMLNTKLSFSYTTLSWYFTTWPFLFWWLLWTKRENEK